MSRTRVFATSLVLSLTLGRVAPAQQHEHESAGRVVFHTSCAPAAQRSFERGVTLLHSFWYEPAEDAFSAAVAADSSCAMGYWGKAMSLLHPLGRHPRLIRRRGWRPRSAGWHSRARPASGTTSAPSTRTTRITPRSITGRA